MRSVAAKAWGTRVSRWKIRIALLTIVEVIMGYEGGGLNMPLVIAMRLTATVNSPAVSDSLTNFFGYVQVPGLGLILPR
jgi:hypothetical protein